MASNPSLHQYASIHTLSKRSSGDFSHVKREKDRQPLSGIKRSSTKKLLKKHRIFDGRNAHKRTSTSPEIKQMLKEVEKILVRNKTDYLKVADNIQNENGAEMKNPSKNSTEDEKSRSGKDAVVDKTQEKDSKADNATNLDEKTEDAAAFRNLTLEVKTKKLEKLNGVFMDMDSQKRPKDKKLRNSSSGGNVTSGTDKIKKHGVSNDTSKMKINETSDQSKNVLENKTMNNGHEVVNETTEGNPFNESNHAKQSNNSVSPESKNEKHAKSKPAENSNKTTKASGNHTESNLTDKMTAVNTSISNKTTSGTKRLSITRKHHSICKEVDDYTPQKAKTVSGSKRDIFPSRYNSHRHVNTVAKYSWRVMMKRSHFVRRFCEHVGGVKKNMMHLRPQPTRIVKGYGRSNITYDNDPSEAQSLTNTGPSLSSSSLSTDTKDNMTVKENSSESSNDTNGAAAKESSNSDDIKKTKQDEEISNTTSISNATASTTSSSTGDEDQQLSSIGFEQDQLDEEPGGESAKRDRSKNRYSSLVKHKSPILKAKLIQKSTKDAIKKTNDSSIMELNDEDTVFATHNHEQKQQQQHATRQFNSSQGAIPILLLEPIDAPKDAHQQPQQQQQQQPQQQQHIVALHDDDHDEDDNLPPPPTKQPPRMGSHTTMTLLPITTLIPATRRTPPTHPTHPTPGTTVPFSLHSTERPTSRYQLYEETTQHHTRHTRPRLHHHITKQPRTYKQHAYTNDQTPTPPKRTTHARSTPQRSTRRTTQRPHSTRAMGTTPRSMGTKFDMVTMVKPTHVPIATHHYRVTPAVRIVTVLHPKLAMLPTIRSTNQHHVTVMFNCPICMVRRKRGNVTHTHQHQHAK